MAPAGDHGALSRTRVTVVIRSGGPFSHQSMAHRPTAFARPPVRPAVRLPAKGGPGFMDSSAPARSATPVGFLGGRGAGPGALPATHHRQRRNKLSDDTASGDAWTWLLLPRSAPTQRVQSSRRRSPARASLPLLRRGHGVSRTRSLAASARSRSTPCCRAGVEEVHGYVSHAYAGGLQLDALSAVPWPVAIPGGLRAPSFPDQ